MYRVYFYVSIFVILSVLSCTSNKKYTCDNCYNIVIHSLKDSLPLSSDVRHKDIIKYEKSLGSVILFDNNSSDTNLYNTYKDSLLNPIDKNIDGKPLKNNYCFDCFFGERDKTNIVAIRPQQHPYIKEVVIYGDNYDKTYKTYYYYQNKILDRLIPNNILSKYKKDTFNLREFWCFRDQLLQKLDSFYKVNDPVVRSEIKDTAWKKNSRVVNYKSDLQIKRNNFNGTDEEYKWIQENQDEIISYYWYSHVNNTGNDKLFIGEFWNSSYDKHGYTKERSTPSDIYLMIEMSYILK